MWRCGDRHTRLQELLDALELAVEHDPRRVGEKHPGWTNKEMWVAQLPRLRLEPDLFVLYEIHDDDGIVVFWIIGFV